MHLNFGIDKDQSLSSLDGETKLRLKSKRKNISMYVHIYTTKLLRQFMMHNQYSVDLQ